MNRNKSTYKGKGNKYGKGKNFNRDNDSKKVKSKSEGRETTEDRITSVQSNKQGYNDLTYYFKNADLLKSVSNLSFQNFLGFGALGSYQVPSVMTLFMNPCPGITYQNSTPALDHPERAGINMAGVKLFSKLSMNSGRNMSYAPQDVTTALLAMSQLLAMHSYVRRLFGVVKLTNPWNRMYPKAIIEAMGIDYDDFIEHWQDYLGYYNAEISNVNQLPILSSCGYLRKCMTQFDYIFTDDESAMAQSYVYVPYSTWVIDEQSYSGGTILKTLPVIGDGLTTTPQKRTFTWIMTNVIRPIISALINSSTLNLVYADLMKLSSTDSSIEFYRIPLLDPDYIVQPVKQPEALVHIHNSRAMSVPPTINNALSVSTYTPYNDVYPDPSNNCLIYNPGFEAVYQVASYTPGDLAPFEIPIDSPVSNPDIGLVAEMTRYTSCLTNNFWPDPNDGNKYFSVFNLLTDWYVVFYAVYQNNTSTPLLIGNTYDITQLPAISAMQVQELFSQFDWHPLLSFFDKTSPKGAVASICGDLNFYTMVPKTWFERVNNAIYLGLFEF